MRSQYIQYSQRGTFINPGGQNYPRAAEHPLTMVVMTLAYRDDRTRGFAVVAREGSLRSTVFHRLHFTCKLYEIRDRRVRPSGSAVFTVVGNWTRWPPEISAKNTVVIFSEHVEVNRGDGCSNEGSAMAVLYMANKKTFKHVVIEIWALKENCSQWRNVNIEMHFATWQMITLLCCICYDEKQVLTFSLIITKL